MKNSASYVSLIHDAVIFIVYVVKIGVPKDAPGEKAPPPPLEKMPPRKLPPGKLPEAKLIEAKKK